MKHHILRDYLECAMIGFVIGFVLAVVTGFKLP